MAARNNALAVIVSVVVGTASVGLIVAVRVLKKTEASVVAKHRPAVEAMLAQVPALAQRVRATPRVTTTTITSPNVLADLSLIRGSGGNAALVHEKDLANPTTQQFARERPRSSSALWSCGYELHAADADRVASGVPPYLIEESLITCAGIRYVLVFRTHELRMARMITSDGFAGGFLSGDVLIYALNGYYYGGFPIHAETADMIPVRPESTMDERNRDLEFHLADKIEDAVMVGLRRALPTSRN